MAALQAKLTTKVLYQANITIQGYKRSIATNIYLLLKTISDRSSNEIAYSYKFKK